MSTVITCPNCGATAEIGGGIESGQFVCAKCKSTVGFGPGTATLLQKTDIEDELTGKTLAGYEVQKLLGVGGMGKVYLARQISIDRPVALKILAPRLAENENFTRRFIREAQAAGRLLHQNLVTVFDAGKEADTYFFSMEYVRGEPISKLIFEKGKVPAAEALAIVRQVAQALCCAFEHGIIHRDIKPDNIMITPSGLVKLADLGLAKQIEGESSETGLTLAGSVMGTPHYLAPEQARDSSSVDQRADVYSLGCTLYHMLTGQVPFSGSSTYEILRKHETQEPDFPADCGVPGPVQTLVRRMMAKDPADRPQTPEEVLAVIDEITSRKSAAAVDAGSLGSMPTEAAPAPAPPGPPAMASTGGVLPTEPIKQPRRKSRIKRVVIIAFVVILILLVLSAIISDKRWEIAQREYLEAQRYAKEHPEDFEGIRRRYNSVATKFKDTKWSEQARQAVAYEEVRAYALENPSDKEGILQRYNDVATKYEGTVAATRAKEAILDIAIAEVEASFAQEPGSQDKLLVQLEQIKDVASDKEFAANISKKIKRLKEIQEQGVELDFRRFKDEVEKLVRQGRFHDARTQVEVYVKDKGFAVIPMLVKRFSERTKALAEIEEVAEGFYAASLAKKWEEAGKHVDPKQEEKKKSLAVWGNILLGIYRAKSYRVERIEVNTSDGTANVFGILTTARRRIRNGPWEERELPVANKAVRRNGKWYMYLEDKPPRQPKEKEDKPRHIPRRPKRPTDK